jgi:GntP family gluconate:H+ symporter
MPLMKIVASINDGFGDTLGYIGIVIIAGTIIGSFLEHSGGVFKLAEAILRFIGKKRIISAMAILGYIVSIPVFADSGFVILSSLNKALSKRAQISLAGPAIALGLGLMVSHTLIPPTPGPLAAASILNADLGLVIIFGLPVSLVGLIVVIIFARKHASKTNIDPDPELSTEEISKRMTTAPPAWKSLLPIVIPIILIILKSISDLPSNPFGNGTFKNYIGFIGAPAIALIIGVLLAFTLPKKLESRMLSATGWVGKALLDAAIIIMITGAGGVFGRIMQNSGIADTLGDTLSVVNIGIFLPFIIASAIKLAQGSSTVAIITTASILAPLLASFGFDSPMAKALVVVTIGCGSFIASHANDSLFWVVTQMSGMDVRTGYKLHTLGSASLGIVTILVVWLISLFIL